MIKHIGVGTCLVLSLMACQAKEQQSQPEVSTSSSSASEQQTPESLRKELYEKARKRNGGKEPTKLDMINELYRKALEQSGSIKNYGVPRVVERGAKPEIVLKQSSIYVDGKELKLGDPIAKWKSRLGPTQACDKDGCMWDELGLYVGLDWRSTPATRTKFINIHLAIEQKDPAEALFTTNADGTPSAPPLESRPRQAFPGYLQLDGFGIDSKTQFWEVLSNVDRKRNLACGLRDCRFPRGAFGNRASMKMRLNRADEYGSIYELSISADDISK